MKDRVLVTGGAGFIGSNLVRLLLGEGVEVVVLEDFSKGRRDRLEGLGVELVESDVMDVPALESVLQNVDAVVHLAAQTGVPGSLKDPMRDFEVNARGTLQLLDACRREVERRKSTSEGGKPRRLRIVFASSNSPLGRQEPPASEQKAPLPLSPYGASKLAGEAYCLAYYGSWGLETVVLRFSNVFGPHSADKNCVVDLFVRKALNGEELIIDGDGGQTRDFIFVEDLCRAILAALRRTAAGEVFQVGTGAETSVSELAAEIGRLAGKDLKIRYVDARQGDIRKNYSEVGKIKQGLGWEPRVSLREGLQRTWDWYRERMGQE